MTATPDTVRITPATIHARLLTAAVVAIVSNPLTAEWPGREQIALATAIAQECSKALDPPGGA